MPRTTEDPSGVDKRTTHGRVGPAHAGGTVHMNLTKKSAVDVIGLLNPAFGNTAANN